MPYTIRNPDGSITYSTHPISRYKIVEIEFAYRTIDRFGDTIDVEHYETIEGATAAMAATEFTGDVRAAVIEKVVWTRRVNRREPVDFVEYHIAAAGDSAALHAGGWVLTEHTRDPRPNAKVGDVIYSDWVVEMPK